MTASTHNHTPAIDFTGYHDRLRLVVSMAKDLGWEIHQDRTGITMMSPVTPKRVRVDRVRQYNENKFKSLFFQVIRNSDPERVGTVRQAILMSGEESLPTSVRADFLLDGAPAQAAALVGVPIEASPTPVRKRRWRRPWRARTGKSLYPSKAVEEIVEEEEVVGYGCSACDFEAPTPQQVAAHYRARRDALHSHGHPQTPIVGKAPEREGYVPSARLVRLLAHALQEAMDSTDTCTADDLARVALVWQHERPDLPDPEPREPLTAEQIVERIRRLVSDDAMTTLQERNEDLERRLDTAMSEAQGLRAAFHDLRSEMDALRQRAEDAEGTVGALRDLLSP